MASSFRSPAKVLRRLGLLPHARRTLTNWPVFMLNYALGLVPAAPYTFRNGARLKIGRGVDHVPIIEIFMREDYGAIPDATTILDLGANVGAFSIYAATTSPKARIYAYEPMPQFFDLLRANVDLNGLDSRVVVTNAAIAGTTGRRSLIVDSDAFMFPTLHAELAPAGRPIDVAATSLEDILATNRLDRVDLAKIDCEGAEYEIIFESPDAVWSAITEIRMEYHVLKPGGGDPDRLVGFLQGKGYAITLQKPTSPHGGTLWAKRP